jgi:hypothetical protein
MLRPTSNTPRRRLLACASIASAATLLFLGWKLLRAPEGVANASTMEQVPRLAAIGERFTPPRETSGTVRVLAPTVLEVTWISKAGEQVAEMRVNRLPRPQDVSIRSGPGEIKAIKVGYKRHPVHAPLKEPQLLAANSLFLELASPLEPGQEIEVILKDAGRFSQGTGDQKALSKSMKGSFDPEKRSPVIHVNQTGYLPAEKKTAMVGYYLGSLGELRLPGEATFKVVNAAGKEALKGKLRQRPDEGFPYPAYQNVWEADFTALREPGQYRVHVPELGYSYPFQVGEAVAAALARTYALGLYHQRCGAANEMPFTRFGHGPCHVAPAAIPDASTQHENSNWTLATENEDAREEPRHTAPKMTSVRHSLYPFVNKGEVDVRGGHHDAGDYSKYTINSASFIHHLVIACDAFPGVVELDNLGIPESGDGKSDVLQIAKWEADFLARMQDADGGF